MSGKDVDQCGLLRSAVERVRGWFSATTCEQEPAQWHRPSSPVIIPSGHVAFIALQERAHDATRGHL